MSARISLVALLLLTGCKPSPSESRKLLSDPDPKKRDEAAANLKEAYAKDPKALGDLGQDYWADRIKKIQFPTAGIADQERAFEELTKNGARIDLGSSALEQQYQLDDFWATAFHFVKPVDPAAKVEGRNVQTADAPRRRVVKIAVPPPPNYTGSWTTYFVHGGVAETTDYNGGAKRRVRTYWENGQVERDASYTGDKPMTDGKEMQYFRDGGVFTESNWKAGKKIGSERTFYESGKLESEKTYVDNKLDGRLTHYRQDGTREWCIDYHNGYETGRGCETPAPTPAPTPQPEK